MASLSTSHVCHVYIPRVVRLSCLLILIVSVTRGNTEVDEIFDTKKSPSNKSEDPANYLKIKKSQTRSPVELFNFSFVSKTVENDLSGFHGFTSQAGQSTSTINLTVKSKRTSARLNPGNTNTSDNEYNTNDDNNNNNNNNNNKTTTANNSTKRITTDERWKRYRSSKRLSRHPRKKMLRRCETFTVDESFTEQQQQTRDRREINSSRHQRDSGVIRAAVLLPFDEDHLWSLHRLKWSIEVGLSRTRSILTSHKIVVTYRDSKCSDAHGPLAAIDLYYNKMADVFLGPVCDYAVAPVARYSPYWDVPIITGGALADDFRDKTEYKLLTRMTGSYTQVGECLAQFFGINGWSTYSLIYNINEGARRTVGRTECHMMLSAIPQILKNFKTTIWSAEVMKSLKSGSDDNFHNNNIFTTSANNSSTNNKKYNIPQNNPRMIFDEKDPYGTYNFTNLLLELTENSRVIVVCANLTSVREILISASRLNLHKGDFAFVLIDLFSSLSKLKRFWFDPDDTAERNEQARLGSEALKIITLRLRSSGYEVNPNYTLELSEGFKKDSNSTIRLQSEPIGFEFAFHDALILYSLAVNETLEELGQWPNGSEVNRRMWNRSFTGIMGNVRIDQNGDRLADYSLLDMNSDGDFEEVVCYYGAEQMFRLLPGKSLIWAGNRTSPPLDTPLCGFDGSLCLPEEFPVYPIAIATLSVALVIAVSAGFMLWKYYDTEAKIAEVYWRVKLDERRISACSVSDIMAGTSPTTKNLRAMYYKSELVATKAVHVPLVITRELRLEFKKMKDLKSDHLNRFIGISIDPPIPLIVWDFCTRGSLHCLLMNSQLKLDNMFRFSLIQDLIKGMSYLHSSYLRCHGNLKSTNCVVDSRFVLKITDYGLHRLKQDTSSKTPFCGSSTNKINLWKAPEIMRTVLKDGDANRLPVEKKQKADVYSFAIICQEIIVQKGTFWIQNTSAKNLNDDDICNEIARGGVPPTRPTLQLPEIHFRDDLLTAELFDVIVKCWSEDAESRPDFTFLKLFVQKIIRSSKFGGNLIENLLSRMEQYASNLEQLVEQKTADWMMEKKTAENLLFAMLPKSVALKRMRNETVEPERYDSVSIYFSDIVGFTTLTEISTPLQIVTVLNDLYTLFDRIIDDFEVYKVETIGDAYMVASGVPIRNGITHAREIARMALSLLHSIKSFSIRHRPHEKLLLRIGIHSGNVCACMVGEKMPHYTLVGDTVNTASRMESNGEALKIHVSSDFKNLLDNFRTFQLVERGPIILKGKKEPMIAWWLVSDTDMDSYIPKINNNNK